MSDIKYPITILNGDIQILDDTDLVTISQIHSYLEIYPGESELEPTFGRKTDIHQSTRNAALYGEIERLNMLQFFADIDLKIKANIIKRYLKMQIGV